MWTTIGASFAALLAVALLARSCSDTTPQAAAPAAAGDVSFEPPAPAAARTEPASPSPVVSPVPGTATDQNTSTSPSKRSTTPRTGPAAQPSGPVTCPPGTVSAAMTDFSVAEDDPGATPDDNGEVEWRAVVRGTVVNKTAKPVRDVHVAVSVYSTNGHADTSTAVISSWLSPGSSTTWTTHHRLDSSDEPNDKDTRVRAASWSWGDAYAKCPT